MNITFKSLLATIIFMTNMQQVFSVNSPLTQELVEIKPIQKGCMPSLGSVIVPTSISIIFASVALNFLTASINCLTAICEDYETLQKIIKEDSEAEVRVILGRFLTISAIFASISIGSGIIAYKKYRKFSDILNSVIINQAKSL